MLSNFTARSNAVLRRGLRTAAAALQREVYVAGAGRVAVTRKQDRGLVSYPIRYKISLSLLSRHPAYFILRSNDFSN